jgi:hypothetical protein
MSWPVIQVHRDADRARRRSLVRARAGFSISSWKIPPKPRLRGAKADSASVLFPLTLLISLALLLTACGAGQKPADVGPRGTLRFAVEPGEAVVEVDEKRLGPASMFETKGLLLKPGQHRVILRAEGFFTEYRLVDISEDQVTVLELDLRPVPE